MIEKNKYITDLLFNLHGMDVSMYDNSFFNTSLQKRINESCCTSVEEYSTLLEQERNECDVFIDSLRISYSEFFRNPLTFAVLEQIILPSIILNKKNTKRKEIRIWSAACAAGQEAYSIAILLEDLKNSGLGNIDYRIFATDQNKTRLDDAQKGLFTASALNNVSLKRINQWFVKQGAQYSVKPELKAYIDFSEFNFFDDQFCCPPESIFGGFDLVLCANLLFYYKNEYREIILEKTGSSLVKGGFIVTGEAEREILMNHNYSEIFPQSAIFSNNNTFQK